MSIVTDGRAARAVRTRAAIVDAMLALLEEGDPRPTASRVARRAHISDRLIYHHFDDLEALLRAVADQQLARVRARMVRIDPTLPLPERLDAFVAQRCDVYEWITPVQRASVLQEPFSAELRAHRVEADRIGRREVTAVFGQKLGLMPLTERRVVLTGLDAAASWVVWDRLRTGGLTPTAARRVVRRMLAALLDADPAG